MSGVIATMPALTEAQFQRQVLDLAHLFGWTVYHPMLSKWSERGYQDLTLVRGSRLVFAELKRETGRTTEHQDRWLSLLGATCAEVHTWRPSDWDAVVAVLGHDVPTSERTRDHD